jgi:hypothetical protein
MRRPTRLAKDGEVADLDRGHLTVFFRLECFPEGSAPLETNQGRAPDVSGPEGGFGSSTEGRFFDPKETSETGR